MRRVKCDRHLLLGRTRRPVKSTPRKPLNRPEPDPSSVPEINPILIAPIARSFPRPSASLCVVRNSVRNAPAAPFCHRTCCVIPKLLCFIKKSALIINCTGAVWFSALFLSSFSPVTYLRPQACIYKRSNIFGSLRIFFKIKIRD